MGLFGNQFLQIMEDQESRMKAIIAKVLKMILVKRILMASQNEIKFLDLVSLHVKVRAQIF